ncbi:voltage-gated potassium channel [Deinococcus metalli]|uniref:Potassium channel n=1 Tax=Deinococcus metalli TaxID=1141878 RepID=A0A7W8NQX9_9DEIO|nr:potassium channel protein [Deinococcus metalli]MBB5376323.1 voltage-gated potassium channel [Deinococcus metalli]GHF39148.1 potassium channel [Deinococcus metalli]
MDRRRLSLLLALILGLVGFGTVGYRVLEGWSWLDCVFMTVMTLTTVGYGSPGPLHTDGKVFSTLLMLVGIGLMLYLLTLLAETVVRGLTDPASVQRRKERKLIHLRGHTVVCGYGQVGEAVCAALRAAKREVVVIDHRPEHLAWAEAQGIHTLVGDATDEDVLRRAGAERAASLVSVINSDPSNLYVVLSAKGLNPQLRVIARASDESAARKMRRAGADEVVNPYQLSGNRIAAMMLAPRLARLLSGDVTSEHFAVREVSVPETLVGRTVADLGRETGALVVAVWRGGHPVVARPNEVLQTGDAVLVAGAVAEVDAVEAARPA